MSYHLLRFLLRIISLIPFKMLYVISSGLFFILYYVVRYRRKIVRRNLTECFPEKSQTEIEEIEKAFYRNFIDNIIETCKMGGMSDDEISRRMIFTNIEKVNEVLRHGTSIAVFLGHYGNWEWVSSMPIHLEKSAVAAQIYHKLRNKNVDRVMLESRASHGAVNVEMYQTARFIMGLARDRQESIIGFIADQSPKKREVHDFITFMHHDTPVLTGTEKIAKHFKFDAWYADMRKTGRGYYEVEFVRMADNPSALPDFKLTEIYYSLLEKSIRRDPSLYLWSHNRFKHARKLTETPSAQDGN